MLKVTCALIVKDKKILITQNNLISDHPLQWEFPGGKIKVEETLENCILREIMEELAIDIEILCSMKPVIYDYGFKQIELIPFLCSIKSGLIKRIEHNDYMWVDLKELKNIDFSEADRKLLEQKQNWVTLKKYFGE